MFDSELDEWASSTWDDLSVGDIFRAVEVGPVFLLLDKYTRTDRDTSTLEVTLKVVDLGFNYSTGVYRTPSWLRLGKGTTVMAYGPDPVQVWLDRFSDDDIASAPARLREITDVVAS